MLSIPGRSIFAILFIFIKSGCTESGSTAMSMNYFTSSLVNPSPIVFRTSSSSFFYMNPSPSSSNSWREVSNSSWLSFWKPVVVSNVTNSRIVKKPLFFLSISYVNSFSSCLPILYSKSLRIFGRSYVLTRPLFPKSKCLKISSTCANSSSSSATN